jgi:cupin fold WbuC family metalloprotein
MLILEGDVDVVLFYDDGAIREVIQMGAPGSGKVFYQRLSDPIFHTLIIRSDFLVFHEITTGPFMREKTTFPDWAPEKEGLESKQFIDQIDLKILKEVKDL